MSLQIVPSEAIWIFIILKTHVNDFDKQFYLDFLLHTKGLFSTLSAE